MQTYEVIDELGSKPTLTKPTLTFGVEPPKEIVGPLNPKMVQYGVSYDREYGAPILTPMPTIYCNFNKFRSDLPPWNTLSEVVLASKVDGGVLEAVLSETEVSEIQITADLKTVTIVGQSLDVGLDNADVVERDRVYDDSGTGYRQPNVGGDD